MKLTAEQKKTRDAVLDAMRTAQSVLDDAVNDYNSAVGRAYSELETARDDYNVAIEEFNSSIQGIGEGIRETIADKSEAWQEGEAGQNADSWAGEWADFSANEFDCDAPDEIEAPENVTDAVGELAEESD